MDLSSLPEMLRVIEAAEVLRISRSQAYDAVAQFERSGGTHGLPCIRIGRCVRVPKSAMVAWINSQLGRSDAA